MRIGVDVGGTHTDAVLMDGDEIVASTKALTTADVTGGILDAIETILSSSGIDAQTVTAVMLGTTQFTNAVIERRELSQVAALRVGLPSGDGLPPMIGWPADIAESLGGHSYMLEGGYLYDGQPLAELDHRSVARAVRDIRRKGLTSVAVTSAFSPMNPQPELDVAEMIRTELPTVAITLSHQIGRIGLLERENAAILNSALLDFASRVVAAFREALSQLAIRCPFYVSQNDGTLMDADFVGRFPALTFASGPTNSLRGASRLTGLDDAIVVDIGGTTSDIGVLQGGFPRESNIVIEVGGVRTNFRMPDILALGLGGGSIVANSGRDVGPTSVGHRLTTEGLVFGGQTLTASDVVVAAGRASIGDSDLVSDVDAATVSTAIDTMQHILDTGIEKMKPGKDKVPIILVGGGSVLVTQSLESASEVLRPEHAGVANAIGAAIAQVGGEAERLVNYREESRDRAIDSVVAAATRAAVEAGADASTVRTADIEETSIAYMREGSTKLRVKAVGDIAALNNSSRGG